MTDNLQQIQSILRQQAGEEAKSATLKFVPGSKKIYGVRNPVLNELAKKFKGGGFELVTELWNAGAYEEKMLAYKLLGLIAKKDPKQSLQLLQQFSERIDNWAECDTLGMQSLKPLVKTHQKEIFALAKKFNKSENMWQRRLSLVLVEYYTRDKTMLPQIQELIAPLKADKEYYIKKAIQWVERNIDKGK